MRVDGLSRSGSQFPQVDNPPHVEGCILAGCILAGCILAGFILAGCIQPSQAKPSPASSDLAFQNVQIQVPAG